MADNISDVVHAYMPHLVNAPQWVAWRYGPPDPKTSKPPKLPVNPSTGQLASSTDPRTWGTFDQALAAAQANGNAGVGVVVTGDDPYTAIDVDHCFQGDPGPVFDIVEQLGSYTERSPSGDGLRMICEGKLPKWSRNKNGDFEAYDHARFVTITGNVYGEPRPIRKCQEELDWYCKTYLGEKKAEVDHSLQTRAVPEHELGQRLEAARRDKKLVALMRGELNGYPSQSEADAALVSKIAFYLGPDPEQIEALARKSALVCDKWDRRDGTYGTYLQRTILNAIARQTEIYQPGRAIQDPPPAQGQNQTSIWDSPLDVSSLIDVEPPPLKWFATDNIPLGRGIIITGIGGSSKTRLIYQLAIGAACGAVPWDWEIKARGKSVLVLTEDTQEDVHRTLYYTCKSFRLSQAELAAVYNSILIYPLAGSDVRLLTTNTENTVVKTELFFGLERKIKSLDGVVFVGLDPALSLTTGDEQDQGHQRALGKMADDLAVNTGATVALVSHATKASQSQDELSSHMSRGGGGITDAVRGEFGMRTMTAKEATQAGIEDIEERKRHVQLVGTKGNLLPPAAYVPVWLRRDQYGSLMGTNISLDQAKGQPTQRDMDVLDVLVEMSKRHTPTLREWRQQCVQQGLMTGKTDNAVQQSMKRSLERLKKSGLIEQGHGKGIWRPIHD